jgi:hypothetical protein
MSERYSILDFFVEGETVAEAASRLGVTWEELVGAMAVEAYALNWPEDLSRKPERARKPRRKSQAALLKLALAAGLEPTLNPDGSVSTAAKTESEAPAERNEWDDWEANRHATH